MLLLLLHDDDDISLSVVERQSEKIFRGRGVRSRVLNNGSLSGGRFYQKNEVCQYTNKSMYECDL